MDKALKQRLVGASVLIALAVIVLPMLLSGGPATRQESRSIELPPMPRELAFETRRFPIGDQPEDEPSALSRPRSASETAPTQTPAERSPGGSKETPTEQTFPGDGEGGQQAVLEPESEPPVPAAESEHPGQSAAGRYLVQVASFSSAGNANRLSARLRENGMPVLMDTVDSTAGILHRVRIGPYERRTDADEAIAALNAQIPDLSPRVIDLRPQEGAPVNVPSDPLVRWAVQVGSFNEESNAEKLVYRLRDAGYSASTAAVSGQTGTAYKVRVGPMIEREDAVVLAESIRQDLGLEGLVVSAD